MNKFTMRNAYTLEVILEDATLNEVMNVVETEAKTHNCGFWRSWQSERGTFLYDAGYTVFEVIRKT